jgi:hypothetical protein
MSPFGNHRTCPFRIMLIVSMPWIVRVADQKERKPWLAKSAAAPAPSSPLFLSSVITFAYDGFPST